jgi:predicted DNA-binding transcriptional regulator AlpA
MAGETHQALLEAVRTAALEAQANGSLPSFLGELERLRIEILVSLIKPSHPPPSSKEERLLSVAEVSERIGRSPWWVYANKNSLPIVRLPTGRYAFSEKGLERWIERRVKP